MVATMGSPEHGVRIGLHPRGAMLHSFRRSLLLLALCAPAVLAQKKVKEVKPGAVELKRLENQWAAGLVRRDRALFDRLLAKRLIYTENDKMMEREAVLRDVSESSDTVTAAHNEDMQVHEFGG